jgi:outer membrane lipoprotein-sorting protein
MDPFESKLSGLRLKQPSAAFGQPKTFATLRASANQPRTILQRIMAMKTRSKAASLVTLAASIALVYALTSWPGGSVAFAEMANKLRAAQTLSFDNTITSTTTGKLVVMKSRNYFMVPGKHRMDSEQGGWVVMDFPAGKTLVVNPHNKTALASPIIGKAPPRDGKDRDLAGETIDHIRSLADKKNRSLGERQMDGVRVTGFEIDDPGETTTLWANAATGEPIRIEVLHNSKQGQIVEVITHIKLDEKLDAALFSVEPPQGYKVEPFVTFNLKDGPADHVAHFLTLYAKLMDGEFPERLEGRLVDKLFEKISREHGGNPKVEDLPADAMRIPAFAAAVAAVLHKAKRENWQYYPDVKLGQKDRVIYWYHDPKTDTYSAVFGDLRVERVTKDQLPAAPADNQ